MDKYKEALNKAKKLMETSVAFDRFTIESIFPELKESDDERIRKWCISHFKGCINVIKDNDEYKEYLSNKVLAWLEKQGEKKQETNYPKFNFDDILAIQCCMETAEKVTEDKELYEKLKSLHSRLQDAYWIGKQSEQKPQGKSAFEAINEEKVDNANKVEPKFKAGDWIVRELDNSVHQVKAVIENISNGKYGYDLTKGGYISSQDANFYHLWTIQDAKAGDVLNSPSNRLIWIYKDNEHYHACVNMNYVTDNVATDGLLSIPNDACPATKDEQTILFARMKESGYEWDAKLKQLRKIENETEIPYGSKDSELQEDTYYIPKGFHAEIDEDKVVIKKGELHIRKLESLVKQIWATAEHENDKDTIHKMSNLSFFLKTLKPQLKQEWSEEDKNRFINLISLVKCSKENNATKAGFIEFINKLKSLRSQNTWKPSDEQMNTLEYYLHTLICNKRKAVLFGLYADLKKLIGE